MPVHDSHTELQSAPSAEPNQKGSHLAETATRAAKGLETSAPRKSGLIAWLKRIGLVGFLFFFIKGLVWLGIFFWAGTCAFQG
jgi:hypothetical protein